MNSNINALIKSGTIQDMLRAFQSCIDIPVQLIDESGLILFCYGATTVFCKHFKRHLPMDDSCAKVHANASKRSVAIGEAYIFSCHANLNHIVCPLMFNDVFCASVLVGPFLMDTPDSTLITDIAKRYSISTVDLLELYDDLVTIRVIEPARVTNISRLLYFLFADLCDGGTQLRNNQQRLSQQSEINESIQMYKAKEGDQQTPYPFDKEKELVTRVKTGDAKAARRILNELLGYVLFAEGRNIDVIRTRAVELTALLSRAAIEGGAATDAILKLNNRLLQKLTTTNDFYDLCNQLQEVVETFTESIFNRLKTKNSDIVHKAMAYIVENYTEDITMVDAANFVHLNPAYFSTIFKRSCGFSFKEFLNMVRIEESKRLLTSTDDSVINIAIAVGYEDHGYFSRVFKKHTGLTPKQYR